MTEREKAGNLHHVQLVGRKYWIQHTKLFHSFSWITIELMSRPSNQRVET